MKGPEIKSDRQMNAGSMTGRAPSIISQFDDYREFLWSELEKRRLRNPAYSQGAFARDLGIRTGRFSEILGGKQGLSRKSAKSISKKLGFSNFEEDQFVDLVIKQHGRSPLERSTAQVRLNARRKGFQYQVLELDRFKLIADWYHIAILELSKVDGFQNNAKWIANAIEVSESKIKEALFTLERLGFLIRAGDRWTFITRDTFTSGEIPSSAIRQFHTQILEKAKYALHEQAVDKREFTSTLIALDRRRIVEIKKRIEVFWKLMDEEFGRDKEKNDVFCLAVQCFSMMNRKDEN